MQRKYSQWNTVCFENTHLFKYLSQSEPTEKHHRANINQNRKGHQFYKDEAQRILYLANTINQHMLSNC